MLGVQVSSSYRDTTLSLQQADDKPHVHVEFVEGLPIWRAALLVVNSALGAGILNFPQAYAECGGIATAFTIQMVGDLMKQVWTKIWPWGRLQYEKLVGPILASTNSGLTLGILIKRNYF